MWDRYAKARHVDYEPLVMLAPPVFASGVRLGVLTAVMLLAALFLFPANAQAASVVKLPLGGKCTLSGVAADVTYTSSKPAVVTVSKRGVVKAHSAGTATLAMRAQSGKVKRVKVRVYKVGGRRSTLVAPDKVVLTRVSSSSLRLKWSSVAGASGYVIYAYDGARYCGQRVVAARVNTLTLSGLQTNTTYRYKVCACKKVSSQTIRVGTLSRLVSARTTNAKSKKANATKVTYGLARLITLTGYSVSVNAQAATSKSNKTVLSKKVRYGTSNPSVATVDANGVVTGVRQGTCYLVCTTHNGRTFKKRIYVRSSLKTSYINFIAHRGAEYTAPENTLAAFKEAGEAGFPGFECDVWETESGDVLVCHENSIAGMCGVDLPISKVSLANRMAYPVTLGVNVNQYETQYLASVQEAIAVAAQYNMRLYLHIKVSEGALMSKTSLKKIRTALESQGMASNTVLFSSSAPMVQRIEAVGGLRSGYLINPTDDAYRQTALKRAVKMGSDCVIFQHASAAPLTLPLVKAAHAAGLEIGCYGMNDPSSALQLIDIRADFGITNVKNF